MMPTRQLCDVTSLGDQYQKYILGPLQEEGENPMASVVSTYTLADVLREVGFDLPKHVSSMQLNTPVDGPVSLTYTVYLEGEDLVKLSKALQSIGERNVR